MTYSRFLTRKLLNSRLTLIALLICLAAIFFTLFQNIKMQPTVSVAQEFNQEVVQSEKTLQRTRKILKEKGLSGQRLKFAQSDSLLAQAQRKQAQHGLALMKAGQWSQVYRILIQQNRQALAAFKKSGTDNDDVMRALNRQNKRLQVLKRHDLAFEPEEYPTHALTFTLSLFDYIIPVLLTLVLVFILVQFFSGSYAGKIDKSRLLPRSVVVTTITEVGTGFLGMIVSLLLVSGLTFLVAAVSVGIGPLNFPVFSYLKNSAHIIYSAVGAQLLASLGLYILSLLPVVLIVYLLVGIFRSKMTALLLSVLLITGTQLLTTFIEPLQKIAQFLPTTYLFSHFVWNGTQRISFTNSMVTPGVGIIVVMVSSFILFTLTLILHSRNLHF